MTAATPDGPTLGQVTYEAFTAVRYDGSLTTAWTSPTIAHKAWEAAGAAVAATAIARLGQPAELAAAMTENVGLIMTIARNASDLEVAAIIAERNQLRIALQRLADDGNLEARDRLAGIFPELAAAMAETRAIRQQLAAVLGWFGSNGSGHYARVSGTILARAYRNAALPVPSELSGR